MLPLPSFLVSLAGCLGLICAVTSTWGVWQEQYALLCVSQVVLGIYNGLQNPAMEALYADSTPPGHRSKYNTYKYVLLQCKARLNQVFCRDGCWPVLTDWGEVR